MSDIPKFNAAEQRLILAEYDRLATLPAVKDYSGLGLKMFFGALLGLVGGAALLSKALPSARSVTIHSAIPEWTVMPLIAWIILMVLTALAGTLLFAFQNRKMNYAYRKSDEAIDLLKRNQIKSSPEDLIPAAVTLIHFARQSIGGRLYSDGFYEEQLRDKLLLVAEVERVLCESRGLAPRFIDPFEQLTAK